MTIFVNDVILDAGIDKIMADADAVHILTAYPANYAAVLADTLGSFAPNIVKKDNVGAGLGRRGEIAASSITVDTATNHAGVDQAFIQYAVVDDTLSTVLYVGNGTLKTLADGDTANTPIFGINILDGVAG